MGTLLKTAALFSSLLFFMNCAGTAPPPPPESDILIPEIDVIQVKENSDEALKLAQEAKLEVEAISTKLTELENKILILTEKVAMISPARLEETENRIAVLSEEVYQLRKALENFKPGDKKLKVPPKIQLATFGPGDSGSAVLPTNRQESLYYQAMTVFNKGKYIQAASAFQKSIKADPGGKYNDDAQFWTGESYRMAGELAKAIEAFEDVFSYVNSDKLDDAQLRIAKTYSQMGDDYQAVEEYRKLINLYPESDLISNAKLEIKRLEN
ncbi:MAG: tetratricopeptide repeat protein [Fibrobacterota bacterium]